MRLVTVICVGTIGILAACQTTTGSQAPVPYESTTRIAPTGVATFKVRSFVKTGDKKEEVKGAACSMKGAGFRSEFATPADVTAPVFGPSTKPVSVTCRYKDQTRKTSVLPYNKTQANANKSLVTLKSATSVTGAVIAAAKIGTAMAPREETRDRYEYRNSAVIFGTE